MTRPDLGTKRLCPTTGRKFYDLGKSPVVSPYTGEIVPIAAPAAFARVAAAIPRRVAVPEEKEREGPELVSLDEAEEADQDTDAEAAGDDAVDDEGGGSAGDDDALMVADEDEDDTVDLVDVDGDEEES